MVGKNCNFLKKDVISHDEQSSFLTNHSMSSDFNIAFSFVLWMYSIYLLIKFCGKIEGIVKIENTVGYNFIQKSYTSRKQLLPLCNQKE